MGTAIAFDTHAYVKKLKAVGFTEEQAEVLSSTQAELIDERLVTKQYLDLRLAELKTDIIKWNVGTVFAAVGLFTAIMKLLG